MADKPSCVLAFSGGLDTSAIVPWLIERGYDVHALAVDVVPVAVCPDGSQPTQLVVDQVLLGVALYDLSRRHVSIIVVNVAATRAVRESVGLVVLEDLDG